MQARSAKQNKMPRPKTKGVKARKQKRFRTVPDDYRVRLGTAYETTLLIGTSFSETILDLTFTQPTNPPKFQGAYFTMYRNAFMHAQHVEIEIVNLGTNPVAAVMAESNSTDSASSSFDAVAQTKGAVYRVIGVAGDGSRTLMRHKYTVSGTLGIANKADSKSWFSPTVTPSYTPRPQLIYGFKCFGTIVGPTSTILVRTRIKYDIEFFTLANDVTNLNTHELCDEFDMIDNEEEIANVKEQHCSGPLAGTIQCNSPGSGYLNVTIPDNVPSKKAPLVNLHLAKRK